MLLISVLENVNICMSIISILDQSIDFFFFFLPVSDCHFEKNPFGNEK